MTYQHKINTTLGLFSFVWHKTGIGLDDKPTKKQKNNYWIAGIFDEPDKAKEIYNCNPYSGKYNFHGLYNYKGYCVMSPLEQLMNHLEGLKESGLLIN